MTERLDLRLDETCKRHAMASAIIDARTTLSYKDLAERAADLASQLQQTGLEHDDPVIVAMSNHAADFSALFAIWKAGGVAVPLHRRSSTSTVSDILSRTGSRLVVNAHPADGLAGFDAASEPILRLADAPPRRRALLKDAAWIMFTSGSTGNPKGVVHAHDTYLGKLDAIQDVIALPPQRALLPLQLTFAYAQWVALTAFLQGGEVIIANPFSPEDFARQLETDIDATAVVPTMLRKLRPLIESEECKPFSGTLMSGGEPLPAELGAFIRNHWPETDIWDVYGLTETATSDFYVRPDAYDSAEGTIGRPAPEIDFRLSPTDNELQIKTPFLMRGYLDAPEMTAATLSDGYFRTGDQARLREDGNVEITGRLSDMINRAGTKIAPLEVERVFSRHPDVGDVLATGLPDAELGEALHIAVIARDAATLDPQALRTWASDQMDRHKLPDVIHMMQSLPTGATGKADRKALRDRLARQTPDEVNDC